MSSNNEKPTPSILESSATLALFYYVGRYYEGTMLDTFVEAVVILCLAASLVQTAVRLWLGEPAKWKWW